MTWMKKSQYVTDKTTDVRVLLRLDSMQRFHCTFHATLAPLLVSRSSCYPGVRSNRVYMSYRGVGKAGVPESNSSPNAVQLGNRALDKGQCVPNNLCLLYLIEANVFFWRATTSRGNGAYNETGSYNGTKEPSALPSFVVWSQEPKARAPPTTPRAGDGAFSLVRNTRRPC